MIYEPPAQPLPIFSDPAFIPRGAPPTIMLYPFWGKPPEDPADPNTGRFDRYAADGKRFFRMAPLDEAELAVFPSDWAYVLGEPAASSAASGFATMAEEAGKRAAAFFFNDSDDAVDLPGATVFRTSLYGSRRRPGEFAQPAWSEDFVERYLGALPVRRKPRQPTVGFCGLAPRGLPLLHRRRASPDPTLRMRALSRLQRTRGLQTNFIVRKDFVGGAVRDGGLDAKTLQQVRREYVGNMLDSDYVLCARGAGNFSYRLYETLSCGRIPVFVDTDCVLPYDFMIEWPEYGVWIDEAAVNDVGHSVLEFHERLNEREFEDLQRECRRFWERYLRPEGFFENLHEHLNVVEPARLEPHAPRPVNR